MTQACTNVNRPEQTLLCALTEERFPRFLERLEADLPVNDRGQVVYRLKHPFHNGNTHVVLGPMDFMWDIRVPHPITSTPPRNGCARTDNGHTNTPPSTQIGRLSCYPSYSPTAGRWETASSTSRRSGRWSPTAVYRGLVEVYIFSALDRWLRPGEDVVRVTKEHLRDFA